jgi:flavorubredoxin
VARKPEVAELDSVVIYTSRYGNTEEIAEAIAHGLRNRGPVQVMSAEEVSRVSMEKADLVVIGGPTEQHGLTESVAHLFDEARSQALWGKASAAFDTRLRWPRWLSGSAGARIAESLRSSGALVIVPEESFFVKGKATHGETPVLESGEPARATAWARSLAETAAMRATEKAR